METLSKNKLYEGMFLIDSSQAASDWEGIISSIRKILEKAKAEIISVKKWDDRRLAYDIKGTSRGTYILSYFKVDGGRITDIEKSVRLSEKIMRVLILNAERLSQEDMEKDTPAMKQERETEHEAPATKKDISDTETSERSGRAEEYDQDSGEEEDELETSDLRTDSDVNTVSEYNTEQQPQDEQFEDSEQADRERL